MKLTKKQQFLLVKLAILAIILMISGLGFFSKNQKKTSNKSNTNQTQVESSVDFSGYDKSKMYTLQVGKVADGDTFHVRLDGKEFKIRLLLIDTPETAKEGKAAQPFADQAKQKTEELLKKAKHYILYLAFLSYSLSEFLILLIVAAKIASPIEANITSILLSW